MLRPSADPPTALIPNELLSSIKKSIRWVKADILLHLTVVFITGKIGKVENSKMWGLIKAESQN